MDLITLSPRIDVDPSQPLRSPGAVLQLDYLDAKYISIMQLARLSGIKHQYIRKLLTMDRPVTATDATRLAIVFGTSAFYWMALQARLELAAEWRKRRVAPTPEEPANGL